ncbi:FTR1 family protein [Actinomyces sp. ZJ308]|uniref:FTR1 family iron permease n=1 Tax=Actinomyces sp. ZJ308 TaxID=2708342 RepID=UPI001FBBA66D|nr:FTR1 family protein [Actinomyces sp. ZJ308]
MAMTLIVVPLLSGLAPRAQAAESATDYDTWSAAAAAVDSELQTAVSQYGNGNTSGAAAGVQRAYNTAYVASNLSRVITDRIGSQRATDHKTQFDSLRQLAYAAGNGESLSSQATTLSADIAADATQLDAMADLPGPRDYAAQQAATTATERAQLDARKTSVNEGRGERSWAQVASEMNGLIDQAIKKTQSGDGQGGAELVNKAYYGYYEKLGFEKTVMAVISGDRVSEVENQFKVVRKAMIAKDSTATTQAEHLKDMITQDAGTLDASGGKVNPVRAFFTGSFGQAFLILLREGLEAILVVAAVIAYLIKAGLKDRVRLVYLGLLLGLVASGIVAVLFAVLFNSASSHQEILEGVVALTAMAMLLFTSNWMLSKSSVSSWNAYIKDKTEASVSNGSVWALASLSFLAVFREGAETVMFYQALLTMDRSGGASIWQGFAVGTVVLVVVFLVIRYTSVKIPLRPFFAITSVLMAILVVIFAGGGLHALIEGDVVSGTYVTGWPTYDFLGIYPYRETLVFQALIATIVVVLGIVSTVRRRRVDKERNVSKEPGATSQKPAKESAQESDEERPQSARSSQQGTDKADKKDDEEVAEASNAD